MKIYISVPISDRKDADTDMGKKIAAKNQADTVKQKLISSGYEAITPFDIIPMDSNISYAEAMGKDMTELLKCDGIYLCSGWRMSNGCQLEYQGAQIFSKTIIENEL